MVVSFLNASGSDYLIACLVYFMHFVVFSNFKDGPDLCVICLKRLLAEIKRKKMLLYSSSLREH